MNIKLCSNRSKNIKTLFWLLESNFDVIEWNLTQLISTVDNFSQYPSSSPICGQIQNYTDKPFRGRRYGQKMMEYRYDTLLHSAKKEQRQSNASFLWIFRYLNEDKPCQAPKEEIGFNKQKWLVWSHLKCREQMPYCHTETYRHTFATLYYINTLHDIYRNEAKRSMYKNLAFESDLRINTKE